MYSSSFDKFYIITACCQNILGVSTTSKKVTMSTSNQILHYRLFDNKKLRFLFSRVNKVVRDFLYWSLQEIP